ncbi:hypothetical protein J2S43_006806 [Catenuloplanes nepalensis]|uniref:Ribosomally synthesized peptide with SipW-like signal peptide n=1 Tax=Catenuloplanes nepalensis TaxID=587533 RepID=A0ABT9N3L6_9ACTN|nr:hypothetical protein [Catenuloplanes nepalensis]MDP9798294.1 hypothetical protein [Catenuloplanes nepalensis]
MSNAKKRGTTIAVAGAVAAIAIGGGVAWAVFTESTSATAAAQAGDLAPLSVVGVPSTDYENDQRALWPGHPADVIVRVKNNNEIPMEVSSVANTAVTGTGNTPNNCAGHIQVNPINIESGPITIGAGQEADVKLLDVITLLENAPNTCQAATFTTTWSITGTGK